MRRAHLFAIPLALCAGCFVLADTEDFVEDESCDLALDLREFSPHIGQTVEVRLTQPPLGATEETAPQLLTLAFFDPLDTPNVDLLFPNSVPALAEPGRERPSLDFYADFDNSGGYSGQPDDHSWRIADPCAPDRDPTFTHDFDFVDLPTPTGRGSALFVDFCPNLVEGGELGRIEPFEGAEPFEVRVTGTFPPQLEGMAEETRAVAFYRLESAATSPMGIRIPDVFDSGFRYRIEVYVDRDDDFAYQGEVDHGWTYFFDLATAEECEPIGEASACAPRVAEVQACLDPNGRDLRVRLSRGHVANFNAPLERSWVQVPEGT